MFPTQLFSIHIIGGRIEKYGQDVPKILAAQGSGGVKSGVNGSAGLTHGFDDFKGLLQLKCV